MTTIGQDVDSIITEENITDVTPAIAPDEPTITPEVGADEPDKDSEPKVDEPKEDIVEEPKLEEPIEPIKVETPEPAQEGLTSTETVQEAQTIIQNLNLTEDKVFNEDGSIKPWEDVVNAGAFLAAQLSPVIVTDKDGNTHEFLTISDVEKKFPDGFEAKNNIEHMKFQSAILENESKFKQAVTTYNNAKTQYTQETNVIVQQRSDNERIGKEYRAMAEQGLVPKVEGSPDDPKFLEQKAVKELNTILEWMETKNKELTTKGLGSINSLYVAKQLMDKEGTLAKKSEEASDIDKERKEVASLSASPAPTSDKPKVQHTPNVPMSTYAEQLIQSEGLK